jgi:predicted membrane protein
MDRITESLDERKSKIVEKLSSEYSLNHISLEEYERLIQYSHNIETEKEFRILEKIIEENKSTETADNSKTVLNNIEREYFTLLSSRQTSGPITNGNFTTILGTHQIFLKEEDLINKETVFNVMVLLGEIVISVPDNVEVINNAIPLLANVSINESAGTREAGKKLIIKGNVVLGEIKIYIKRH